MYRHGAHHRAGNGQGHVEEHSIGTQPCAAAAAGDVLDRLHAQCRVHQRQPETGQPGANQRPGRRGRQPQKAQAQHFGGHAGDRHVVATKAVDRVDEQQPRDDEAHTKRTQAPGRTGPAALEVVQGDEGGQGAVADRGQGQTQATRGNPAERRPEGQALAAHHDHVGALAKHQQGKGCQHQQSRPQHAEVQPVHGQHADRRTDGDRAIGGDTVPRDHPGSVFGADLADAPAQGGHADQPLGDAQQQASTEQQCQA
ncbi:hypothetical protein D3C76_593530 [compost metagenome]